MPAPKSSPAYSGAAPRVPAPDPPTDWITTPEVAALLQVPESRVFDLRKRGTGPRWYKLGHRDVRYSRADVLAWLEEKARAPKSGR